VAVEDTEPARRSRIDAVAFLRDALIATARGPIAFFAARLAVLVPHCGGERAGLSGAFLRRGL